MSEVWIIPSDWPARAVEPLDREAVLDALDEVSAFYGGAVASLSETVVPVVVERVEGGDQR